MFVPILWYARMLRKKANCVERISLDSGWSRSLMHLSRKGSEQEESHYSVNVNCCLCSNNGIHRFVHYKDRAADFLLGDSNTCGNIIT